MKLLTRDFTTREKVLLSVLAIILVGLLYYRFIDIPVRDSLARAEAQKSDLQAELTMVNAQVMSLQRKQDELNGLVEAEDVSYMPSYNNERNVAKLLNDVLTPYGYSIAFSNVSRSGDQVRRNISLQFHASSYSDVEEVLTKLTHGQYRCLINNVSGAVDSRSANGGYSISTVLTFYETMVGGTPDAGLPE